MSNPRAACGPVEAMSNPRAAWGPTPQYLPHVSHLAKLVTWHFHGRVAHFSVNHTLNAICQWYWIIKAAVADSRMISKCVNCGRQNSPPGRQVLAELPPAKLQIDTPQFLHVGVDYLWPVGDPPLTGNGESLWMHIHMHDDHLAVCLFCADRFRFLL